MCIFQSPGNDQYIYKNRTSRLFPIPIPKSYERIINDKKNKLKCAIPLSDFTTPFMLATTYIDYMCYLLNVVDIHEHILVNKKIIDVMKTDHKDFIIEYFQKYNRILFDISTKNTVCAITRNIILTKDIADITRDNRIDIKQSDIQLGHIISRRDTLFTIRGLNIVMMSREGNRIIGEENYIENRKTAREAENIQILKLYFEDNMRVVDISRKLGVSDSKIYLIISKYSLA
jgi:hypothetical protein